MNRKEEGNERKKREKRERTTEKGLKRPVGSPTETAWGNYRNTLMVGLNVGGYPDRRSQTLRSYPPLGQVPSISKEMGFDTCPSPFWSNTSQESTPDRGKELSSADQDVCWKDLSREPPCRNAAEELSRRRKP